MSKKHIQLYHKFENSKINKHLLLHCFCYIISLSSFAYIFTVLYIIQYTIQDYNDNNKTIYF